MKELKNLFTSFQNAMQNEIGFVIAAVLFTAAIIGFAIYADKKIKKTIGLKRTSKLTLTAVFAALAAILMYIEIPVFFAPSFYNIDLSEIPILIAGFTMGPLPAAAAELIKILIKLLIKPTSTAFVGEFANLIVGLSLVVPASILYHYNKTKKNAIFSMGIGTLIMTLMAAFMNAFILLPAFAYLYGNIPVSALIDMGSAVNPAIKNMTTFILLAVTPFNILKGVITSFVVVLIYKKISNLLKITSK